MTLWPAREVARQGVQATADWVGSVVGPVDPATARAIADSITAAGEPVVAAVPETIPLPGVIAAALPGARA